LSFYGTTQEVKAVASRIASFREIEADDGTKLLRTYANLRFASKSIGYGKNHCLLWVEGVKDKIIIYSREEDKYRALEQALSKRKIPFLKEWVTEIDKLLLKSGHLTILRGWGIFGYECNWEDDEITDILYKEIYRRKNEIKGIHREVRDSLIRNDRYYSEARI
ncbi:MAG: hypothetical protein ACK415_09115, partial [Thermodesulfovibrionales bacterium]